MSVAMVGLGWDARVTDGAEFDLDASVFMVGEDGKSTFRRKFYLL